MDQERGLLHRVEKSGGWISLRDYMAYALYNSEIGYYSTRVSDVGKNGDFSTTATLSNILSRALVSRYWALCRSHGYQYPVIEIGGGDGSLARNIKCALGFWKSLRVEYYLVETSQPLRERQRAKAGRFIHHAATPGEALEQCGGRAFIISNELVDAFPARIFIRGDREWEELGLALKEGRLFPEARSVLAENLPDSTLWEGDFPLRQQVEIHESFRDWCDVWAPLWTCGEMITVDYGAAREDLYYRRPRGTLRGYLNHQRLEGLALFRRPGSMDLTCDVNFSDLISWGEYRGWRTAALTSQRDFLLPFSHGTDADLFLTHAAGAGTAFMVLIQRCGEE